MAITLTLVGVADLSSWTDSSGDPNGTYTLTQNAPYWEALSPSPFNYLRITPGAAGKYKVSIYDGVSIYEGTDVNEQSAGVPANGVYPGPSGSGGTWTAAGFGGGGGGGFQFQAAWVRNSNRILGGGIA